MRKLSILFIALLAVVMLAGAVQAVNIPRAEDPLNGPGVWLMPVYNNSGSTMDEGDVAVWDIGSSTGDDDNYVTVTTTADTHIVAGVVYGADIAASSVGLIAIKGVVPVDCVAGHLSSAGGYVCSSTTSGSAANCNTTTANSFGVVAGACSSGTAKVFVNK